MLPAEQQMQFVFTLRSRGVTNADVLKAIHDDLKATDARHRPYIRYFTITHLYNAGLNDDQLQTYRQPVSRQTRWHREDRLPRRIEGHRQPRPAGPE